jgi:hypothetical protein
MVRLHSQKVAPVATGVATSLALTNDPFSSHQDRGQPLLAFFAVRFAAFFAGARLAVVRFFTVRFAAFFAGARFFTVRFLTVRSAAFFAVVRFLTVRSAAFLAGARLAVFLARLTGISLVPFRCREWVVSYAGAFDSSSALAFPAKLSYSFLAATTTATSAATPATAAMASWYP